METHASPADSLAAFDADTMSSEERYAYLQNIRSMYLENNAKPSEEQLNNAVACLRADRKQLTTRPKTTKTKTPMKAYDLDDL